MIVLITPTGGRPLQFAHCMHWMQGQSYAGAVTWLVVDDCVPRTTDDLLPTFRPGWTIIKLYPVPAWQHGQNTQGRNLSAAMLYIKQNFALRDIEAIFIIEDDDFYRATYLERMLGHIAGYNIAGETHTIYYNVYHRTHVTNQNATWSSLFQTAFTPAAIQHFEKFYTVRFIDFAFFQDFDRVHLFRDGNLAVGMKGMPGRYGIGAGHSHAFTLNPDPGLIYLQQLIGEENALHYSGYYRDNRQPQHPLFLRKSRK